MFRMKKIRCESCEREADKFFIENEVKHATCARHMPKGQTEEIGRDLYEIALVHEEYEKDLLKVGNHTTLTMDDIVV